MSQPTVGQPQIFQCYDNVTNQPLAGGQLFTYVSGTNTPLATYYDIGLTSPCPNPIILDNYGQAVFYLKPQLYRFNLLNAQGVQEAHYPQDNIAGSSAVQGQSKIANGSATSVTVSGQYSYITTSASSMATTFPAGSASIDGLQMIVVFSANVATATWVSSGATFVGAPASIVANTPYRFVYFNSATQWLPF